MKRLVLFLLLAAFTLALPAAAQTDNDGSALPRAALIEVDYVPGPLDRVVIGIGDYQVPLIVSDEVAKLLMDQAKIQNPSTELVARWTSSGQPYTVRAFQGPYEPSAKAEAAFEAAVDAMLKVFPPDSAEAVISLKLVSAKAMITFSEHRWPSPKPEAPFAPMPGRAQILTGSDPPPPPETPWKPFDFIANPVTVGGGAGAPMDPPTWQDAPIDKDDALGDDLFGMDLKHPALWKPIDFIAEPVGMATWEQRAPGDPTPPTPPMPSRAELITAP